MPVQTHPHERQKQSMPYLQTWRLAGPLSHLAVPTRRRQPADQPWTAAPDHPPRHLRIVVLGLPQASTYYKFVQREVLQLVRTCTRLRVLMQHRQE